MDHDIMATLFPDMQARRDAGLCPSCGNPIGDFRDALSFREFKITGMCQRCQDDLAALEDDEDGGVD